MGPPPLKRHATAESKLPQKLGGAALGNKYLPGGGGGGGGGGVGGGGGGGNGSAVLRPEGRENQVPASGRRLRSSARLD